MLLSDGSSDRALLPLLTKLLHSAGVTLEVNEQWADESLFPNRPRSLAERIQLSATFYPCDLLFIHRDAESASRAVRVAEIQRALAKSGPHAFTPPAVCVVPVRMTEAWLLTDELAIRKAAGNPHGKRPLGLTRPSELERLRNPKQTLFDLFLSASELGFHRRQRFNFLEARNAVADYIEDFSALLTLPAFQALKLEVGDLIAQRGWN